MTDRDNRDALLALAERVADRPDTSDVTELANAIVVAWEQSRHDFPVTYPHQLQMALIAARFLVSLADDDDAPARAAMMGEGSATTDVGESEQQRST